MTPSSGTASSAVRTVPFDRELAAVLEQIEPNLPRHETVEGLLSIRQGNEWSATDEQLRCGGRFELTERSIPGPADAPDVSLLVCRPLGSPSPTPAFYYVHGGGMVMGGNRVGVPEYPLQWAMEFGAAVVSVEYRVAPETQHPGPVEDCYAGLAWTAEHADELGIDASRIVLTGVSAGGGLAAATALLARDRGGPALAGQVLICPMLDDRNDTASALQMDGHGVWDRRSNLLGWRALLGEACGGPDVSPYAAPGRADDLSGLPPTFLDVGSAETFRDEVVSYASRIWQAGGEAELHVWAGGFHGFDSMAPAAAVSADARDARVRWLARLLRS